MNPGLTFDVTYASFPTMHCGKPCENEVHFSISLKRVLITGIIYFKNINTYVQTVNDGFNSFSLAFI